MSLLQRIGESLESFSETPAMACWGASDFCFDDHFLKEWQARLPHLVVNRHAGAGHYVLEDAGEKAITAIRDFLCSDQTE